MPYKNPEDKQAYYLRRKAEETPEHRTERLAKAAEIRRRNAKPKVHRVTLKERLVSDPVFAKEYSQARGREARARRDARRAMDPEFDAAWRANKSAEGKRSTARRTPEEVKVAREWAAAHPEEYKEQQRKKRHKDRAARIKERCQTDPVFKAKYLALRRAVKKRSLERHPLSPEKHEERRLKRETWKAANPEKIKLLHRKHTLRDSGWTVESYDLAFAEQGGVCAICGDPPVARKGNPNGHLFADHEHVTPPKPRALLCCGCNSALGSLRERPELFLACIEYLRKHGK